VRRRSRRRRSLPASQWRRLRHAAHQAAPVRDASSRRDPDAMATSAAKASRALPVADLVADIAQPAAGVARTQRPPWWTATAHIDATLTDVIHDDSAGPLRAPDVPAGGAHTPVREPCPARDARRIGGKRDDGW